MVDEGKYRIDKNKFERYKKIFIIALIPSLVTLLFNFLIPPIIINLIYIVILILLIFTGLYLRNNLQKNTEYLS